VCGSSDDPLVIQRSASARATTDIRERQCEVSESGAVLKRGPLTPDAQHVNEIKGVDAPCNQPDLTIRDLLLPIQRCDERTNVGKANSVDTQVTNIGREIRGRRITVCVPVLKLRDDAAPVSRPLTDNCPGAV